MNGERPSSEFSHFEIAVARAEGRFRVDDDHLGWITPRPTDRCVCGHVYSAHGMRGDVLACSVASCACGPGCIHEGWVAWDSGQQKRPPCTHSSALESYCRECIGAMLQRQRALEAAARALLAHVRFDHWPICQRNVDRECGTCDCGAAEANELHRLLNGSP